MRAAGKQVLVGFRPAPWPWAVRRLGLTGRKTTLPEKQAAAAAGQSLLMHAWEQAFAPHDIGVAQILLTRDDTETRRRWLNARATTETLMGLGVVPVVNENDTVVTEEIRYGDNDRLAARVAQMAGADLLVLLSDIDGLYTADPRKNPNAAHIPLVSEITPEIAGMAEGANAAAGVGTGGMATKIAAARIARAAGCATLITLGSRPHPLAAIAAGEKATLIEAGASPAAAYEAWIAGSLAPQGVGDRSTPARPRPSRRARALLSAGVRAVEGPFDKGDAVRVRDETGREVARGIVRTTTAPTPSASPACAPTPSRPNWASPKAR
ncbi:glutamate 5-kinase [Caulobacter segnis]